MAEIKPSKKRTIFKLMNERKIPWDYLKFDIEDEDNFLLGKGNFAEVYKMSEIGNPDKKYAVKVIGFSEHRRISSDDIGKYKVEAIFGGNLSRKCRSVVRVYDHEYVSIRLDNAGNVLEMTDDASGVDKQGWLTLLLIRMELLSKVIDSNFAGDFYLKNPKLQAADEAEVLKLALDIAEALKASHGSKPPVIHRDVKLENIFYDDESGKYKLGDFGIARITNQGSATTRGAGTLGYEAPEVEGGSDSKYSYQADIYSLGITIYLLLNDLKLPGSNNYKLNRHVQYNPNAVIEPPAHGSEELRNYVLRMIRFKPEERPRSVQEVHDALEAISKNISRNSRESEKAESVAEDISQNINGNSTEQQKKDSPEKEYIKKIEREEADDSIIKAQPKVSQPQGSIVAEVKKKTLDDQIGQSDRTDEVRKTENAQSTKKTRKPKTAKSYKILGGIGFVLIVCGLAYFELLTVGSLDFAPTLAARISLGLSTVTAVAAMIMKFAKKKRMPLWIYFVQFVFSVYVMITGGFSWLYLILAISLLLGGVSENAAVVLSCWLFLLLKNVVLIGNEGFSIPEKHAWIFMILAVIGYYFVELNDRYDGFERETESILSGPLDSILFIMDLVSLLVIGGGLLMIIAGIVIWILNKIPSIEVGSLLLNLHFVISGIIIFVVGLKFYSYYGEIVDRERRDYKNRR